MSTFIMMRRESIKNTNKNEKRTNTTDNETNIQLGMIRDLQEFDS